MIHKKGSHIDYLYKYKEGKIKEGLGIGCELDDFLRFKPKQLNLILGHDNVGKTFFCTFYFLSLALHHDLRFCIWSGENQHGQIIRDMIQMLSGDNVKNLSHTEIRHYSNKIEAHFDFVDNKQLYKPKELLKIFENTECDACLIDPFTGLERSMRYEDNYKFLNECRHFCNVTGKTIYVNTHPVSESGRGNNVYAKGHNWEGHIKAPRKDDAEGGKPFTNRTDDIIILHRLTSHKDMKFYTLVTIAKVRDTETGGQQTNFEEPVLCDYNYGKGFLIGGVDPLKNYRQIPKTNLWTVND